MNISDYEQVYQLWLSCAGVVLNNLDDSKEGIATKLVNEAMGALKTLGIIGY